MTTTAGTKTNAYAAPTAAVLDLQHSMLRPRAHLHRVQNTVITQKHPEDFLPSQQRFCRVKQGPKNNGSLHTVTCAEHAGIREWWHHDLRRSCQLETIDGLDDFFAKINDLQQN